MIKQPLLDQITDQLQQALDNALLAASEAHNNATHAESAAETQYDTLGLENAYLAHGQSMRVESLQQALMHYQQWTVMDFQPDDAIGLGALVEVTGPQGQQRLFLLGPLQGGLQLHWQGQPVTLITPQTPVGQQLMARYLGDEASLPNAEGSQLCEVTALS